jgi:hypothetical protein
MHSNDLEGDGRYLDLQEMRRYRKHLRHHRHHRHHHPWVPPMYGDAELMGKWNWKKFFLAPLAAAMPLTALISYGAKKRRDRRLAEQRQQASLTSNPVEKADMKEVTSEATAAKKELAYSEPAPSMPSGGIHFQEPQEEYEQEPEMMGMDMKSMLPIILIAGVGAVLLLKKKKRHSRRRR